MSAYIWKCLSCSFTSKNEKNVATPIFQGVIRLLGRRYMVMLRPQRALSVWKNRVSTVSSHCERDRGTHSVIDLAWILMPVSELPYRRDGAWRVRGLWFRMPIWEGRRRRLQEQDDWRWLVHLEGESDVSAYIESVNILKFFTGQFASVI